MDVDDPKRRIVQLCLGAVVLAAVVWFFASGTFHAIRPERVRDEILRLGAWGPLIFVLAFTTIQPLGPSSHIFVLAASLVWSPVEAFALSMAGIMGSQVASFVFYRYVARDWARTHLPAGILAYESRLMERPFRTVFLMRIFTFTWHPTSILIGISRIRWTPMLAATLLGLAPTVAFDVWFLAGVRVWLAS